MTAPRILLVDDQRQVSRMLRASLELSGQDYNVTDVASAEEALIELSRGPIDLLVADVRLPGMSGLELLAKVRAQNPKARAILITGAPSDEVEAEAAALGVIAFLRKPLGTNLFLEAVARGLESSAVTPSEEAVDEERPRIAERLAALRRALGAEATILVGDNGRVVARAGDLVNLDLDATLPSLMPAFSAGLKVSHLLGAEVPGNLQYFNGSSYDFYMTNVGASFCLLIAFQARPEAGQMGAVVHFGRRAAVDLLAALSSLGAVEPEPPAMAEAAPPAPPPTQPVKEVSEKALATAARKVGGKDVQSYWDNAVADTRGLDKAEGDSLSYEQARRLGLLPDQPEPEG
jgi:CheY-like chemotaxis protein